MQCMVMYVLILMVYFLPWLDFYEINKLDDIIIIKIKVGRKKQKVLISLKQNLIQIISIAKL